MNKATKLSRWFSANPDKAWGEKFFLVYSLVWMTLMGISVITSLYVNLGDAGMLVMATVIAAPIVLYPLVFHRRQGIRWYETYSFKANLFIFILSFFQNYFLCPYFFDVLGMVYKYPNVTTHLEAALVGVSNQPVPLIMYFYTQCFYMTYHITAIVVIRRVFNSRAGKNKLAKPVMFILASLFWAFMETFLMSKVSGLTFWYKDVARMMKFGTFIYAYSFIASFPLFFSLDEEQEKKWSPGKVALYAFAANAIALVLFDITTQFIGHL